MQVKRQPPTGKTATAKGQRVLRIVRLLQMLRTRSEHTVADMAGELDVSERMLHRDLRVLQAAGILGPYQKRSRSYKLADEKFLPSLELTAEEAVGLVAIAELAGCVEPLARVSTAAGRAVEKILSLLPANLREDAAGTASKVSVHLPPGDSAGVEDVFARLRKAIARRQVVQCEYESRSRKSQFLLKPYHMVFLQRAWYVVGHHGEHNEVRLLKLSRMEKATPTVQRFTMPQDFKLESFLGLAWRCVRGEPVYDVELVFDAAFADSIEETDWHHTQQTERLNDGRLKFTCQVAGLDEIVWWVLSMGPHCEVRKPLQLRDMVVSHARSMLALYEE